MRVAVQQSRGVDVEIRSARRRDAAAADGVVRQRLRHRRGQASSWFCACDQDVVAHVEIGGDLAGADRLVGDQIDGRAVRRHQHAACRALLLAGSASHCVAARHRALRRRTPAARRRAPTSWTPELVKTLTWLRSSDDDPDVHQLGQLIDVVVALIRQRRIRGVARRRMPASWRVDRRDLLHRVVGGRDRVGEAVLGVAAQRLDVGGHAVERLRQHLRGAQHDAARRGRIPGSSPATARRW